MKTNIKLLEVMLFGACLLSCLSQLPFFVSTGMTQMVSFPFWVIAFLFLFLNSRGKISKSSLCLIIPAFIFISFILLAYIFNSSSTYFSSSLFYSYVISMFIFLIGNMAGKYTSEKMIKSIYWAYIVGTAIVSVSIFVQYFGFGYDLSSRIYAYGSKNSFAQIVFTAVVLLVISVKPRRKVHIVMKWGLVAFEILLMVYLRSRASLASLFVVVAIVLFSRSTRKSLKWFVVISAIILFVLVFANESLYETIFFNVILAGRDASNLDDLSSGRITILRSFPDIIKGSWFFGIGATYFECFYLSAILQFGILGGLVLIYISLVPAYYGICLSKNSENWYILMLISVGYLVNGLFEGLTPFGAGIKCYFLWLLFGLLISRKSYNRYSYCSAPFEST